MNTKLEELLKDRLKKELEDVIEYNELYNVLDNDKDKFIIEHIANEEFEHAQVVRYMIEEYCIKLGIEYDNLWERAEKCFR